MLAFPQRVRHGLITVWTVAVLVFVLSPGRHDPAGLAHGKPLFHLPDPASGASTGGTRRSPRSRSRQLLATSLSIAAVVTVIAVAIAFFGALAFARYDWRGRSLYQKLVLLADLLSADRCSALRCCSGSTRSGSQLSWKTAVFAHLVWIVPVVTLVIAIQLYSLRPGARGGGVRPRRVALAGVPRSDAAGALSRHLFRRAVRVPAVVGQLPAVALHDRRRYDGARVPLCQDGRRLYAGRPGARHGLDHRREPSSCWAVMY